MKFSLFFLVVFMIVVQNEVMGNPVPNPAPDNDVHFHVNLPGSGRSFPFKGKEGGDDYAIINKGTFSDGFTQDVTGNGNSNFINEGTVKGKVSQITKDCERKVKGSSNDNKPLTGDDYAIINKGTFSGGFTQDITGNGNPDFVNEGIVKGKVTQKIKDCVRKVKGTRSKAPEDIDNSPEWNDVTLD